MVDIDACVRIDDLLIDTCTHACIRSTIDLNKLDFRVSILSRKTGPAVEPFGLQILVSIQICVEVYQGELWVCCYLQFIFLILVDVDRGSVHLWHIIQHCVAFDC